MNNFSIGDKVLISTGSVYAPGEVGEIVGVSEGGTPYTADTMYKVRTGKRATAWIAEKYLSIYELSEADTLTDKELRLFYKGLYQGYKQGIETLIRLIGEQSDE